MTLTKENRDKIIKDISILLKRLEIINENNIIRYHIGRASFELGNMRRNKLIKELNK